jgi:hypothetical protein
MASRINLVGWCPTNLPTSTYYWKIEISKPPFAKQDTAILRHVQAVHAGTFRLMGACLDPTGSK